ncbi:MAG: lycopene cyclase domain-containing protein [Actinomycetales bacterium]|nr:lycopene cyclase domain-containing protein [Actinomycetales bacterium]
MTYTQLAILSVLAVVAVDLWLLRTRMVLRRVFWASYAIIFVFQLISNGMFTGFGIVRYDGDAIIGGTSPSSGPPPFIGDGRLAFAPVEDLLFGFALILLSISEWIWLGRRGIQRTPVSGPPIWRTKASGLDQEGRTKASGPDQEGRTKPEP